MMVKLVNNIKIKKVWSLQVVRNSVYNFARFVVPLLLLIVFTPILVARMGEENYGLWMLAMSMLGVMGIFEMGFGAAVTKYTAEYLSKGDVQGLSAVMTLSIVFHLLVGTLLTVLLYHFAPKIVFLLKMSPESFGLAKEAMQIMAFGLLPVLLTSVVLALPMGLQRYEFPSMLFILRGILTQVAALVVVLLHGTAYHVIISTVFVLWLVGVASLLVALKFGRRLGMRFFFRGAMLVSFSLSLLMLCLQE